MIFSLFIAFLCQLFIVYVLYDLLKTIKEQEQTINGLILEIDNLRGKYER